MLNIILSFLTFSPLPQVELVLGGVQSVHGGFSLLLLSPCTLCSSMDPPQTAGDICYAMEHLPPLLTLVFHLFLTLFVPFFSLHLTFSAFFNIYFHGGTVSLADMPTCVLWWIQWNQLDLAVSGMRQALTSHRGHPCSLPGYHLAICTQNTYGKVLCKNTENWSRKSS